MLIVNVAGLKAFAEIRDDKSDVLLSLLVTMMSARIQKHLNRFLEKDEYTEYGEVRTGKTKYYLPAYPIEIKTNVTSLVVTDDDEVLEIDDDYYVREDIGLVTFDYSPVYRRPKQLKFVWTGGYDVITDSDLTSEGTIDCDEDIKLATYMQISYMYKRRNELGLTSVSISGGFTIGKIPPIELLTEVKDMLYHCRRKAGRR